MVLADVELQHDIMVVDNLTLETAVKMAVAKETAKRSVDTLDTDHSNAAISAYKKESQDRNYQTSSANILEKRSKGLSVQQEKKSVCVAFWDISRGTASLVESLKREGIPKKGGKRRIVRRLEIFLRTAST